jgi:hypothetical protein
VAKDRVSLLRMTITAVVVGLAAGALVGGASARPFHPLHAPPSNHRGAIRHGHPRRHRGPRPAIVGGLPAPVGRFPYMAFVEYFGTSSSFACSGTVISSNVVLTAGHCVVDTATGIPDSPSGYQVFTGSLDWTNASATQVSGVTRTVIDPGFNRFNGDGDAGLLVLSTPTTAPAIRLATTADIGLIQPGTGADITGWGETYYGAGVLPQWLQWGTTVVQSPAYCSANALLYDATKLCALDFPTFVDATCHGDSGGPSIAYDSGGNPVEIGITSTGDPYCSTAVPDVFTRVDLLSSWATGWVAAVAPPPPPQSPPPPPVATMTRSDARALTRQTLTGVFGRRFRHGHQYKAQCARVSTTRFKCAVQWWYGPNVYWGNVTVHNEIVGTQSKWFDSYWINAINNACYNSHPNGWSRLCKIHASHGS